MDIPLADQVVQVGHACLEAGQLFARPDGATHLVVLGLPSAQQLRTAVSRI